MSNSNTNTPGIPKQVVFLGETRFPFGLAAVQRMTLMAKAFLHVGIKPTIICRKGSWKVNEHINFSYKGNFEGIDYVYTSKNVHKPKGLIKRNIQKLIGIYGEFQYLKSLKRNSSIDLAILSNRKVVHVMRYLFYSIYFDFPLVINFVEMASSMQHRTGLLLRINDYLIDNWAIKLFDGALPISDKLKNYYKSVSPSKPFLKLPIICDFEKFEVKKKATEPYFLYCGSFGYREVIDFVVDAYKEVCVNNDVLLYMIVSGGTKNQTSTLERDINSRLGKKTVKLYSNIPYEQLVELYVNALALLIPLRPTLQDTARFPHKIGEYLASGNPVITTSVGEINIYFEDGKTALVADNYEKKLFAKKMSWVLKHPDLAVTIGQNGKELGLNEFDYRTHGNSLGKFMRNFKD